MHVGGFFNWMQRDGFLNAPGVQITVKNFSFLSVVMKEKSAHLRYKKKFELINTCDDRFFPSRASQGKPLSSGRQLA